MTLYAKYTHPKAEYTPEDTKNRLTLNQTYEVSAVNMGQSYTSISLVGFPNQGFNSVSFDFYHDDEPINLIDFPEYNPYYYEGDDDEE